MKTLNRKSQGVGHIHTRLARPQGIMSRAEAAGWAKAARVAIEDVEDGGTERRCEVLERIELRLRWLLKKGN